MTLQLPPQLTNLPPGPRAAAANRQQQQRQRLQELVRSTSLSLLLLVHLSPAVLGFCSWCSEQYQLLRLNNRALMCHTADLVARKAVMTLCTVVKQS